MTKDSGWRAGGELEIEIIHTKLIFYPFKGSLVSIFYGVSVRIVCCRGRCYVCGIGLDCCGGVSRKRENGSWSVGVSVGKIQDLHSDWQSGIQAVRLSAYRLR